MDEGKGKRARAAGRNPRGVLQVVDEPGRNALIREAAYLLSERRGFDPHWDVTNWLEAERQVDAQLAGRGRRPRTAPARASSRRSS